MVDIQFKLSVNREAEFVTYDKQQSLDMMFVIYSAQKNQDSITLEQVREEMQQLGGNHNQWDLLNTMYRALECKNDD